MKFIKRLTTNLVFLLPVITLVLGLISVSIANDKAQALYKERFQFRFESDAALRFLIRNSAIEVAQRDFEELVSVMSARSYEGANIFEDSVTRGLVDSFGGQLSARAMHIIIGSVYPGGEVFVEFAFPRKELVGRDISQHPMLADFNLGLTPPFTDQINYRASLSNDLSYTSDGALAIRRMLINIPNTDNPLIFILKANSTEVQRATDGVLRDLGPIPSLTYTVIDPLSGKCMSVYLAGEGEKPCELRRQDFPGAIASEKFGVLAHINPSEAYIEEFEGGRPPFAYLELLVVLSATTLASLFAVFIWRRLGEAERQMLTYQGTITNKDQLMASLHAMVVDNLEQVGTLAQRIKGAHSIDNEERRYVNIALLEITQLRLSLDAQIMMDKLARGDEKKRINAGVVDTKSLCRRVRSQLERMSEEEGLECRLLADDELPASLVGSQYWIESAIFALINACQSFTDEGFIEVSIWVEASMQGEAELCVRARDTGLAWSTDDDAEQAAVRILGEIISGLGAELTSQPFKAGVGQEHIIYFSSSAP